MSILFCVSMCVCLFVLRVLRLFKKFQSYCDGCPCVTSSPQAWLGEGNPPRPVNNLVRKQLYRYLLHNVGAERTLAKIQSTCNKKKNESVMLTLSNKREKRPNCVLEQVWGLYPNHKNMSYMGHFWWYSIIIGPNVTWWIHYKSGIMWSVYM